VGCGVLDAPPYPIRDKSHLIGLLSFHHFVVPLPPQREARKILSLPLLRGGGPSHDGGGV
ncbi:MAG: hypothetical protein IJN37_05945, partial [Clostridia bacterium]|nr:hypothetical protein [Clostridia bacterium]